jgi:hypothetical protein
MVVSSQVTRHHQNPVIVGRSGSVPLAAQLSALAVTCALLAGNTS